MSALAVPMATNAAFLLTSMRTPSILKDRDRMRVAFPLEQGFAADKSATPVDNRTADQKVQARSLYPLRSRRSAQSTRTAAMATITAKPAHGRSTVWPMSAKRIASIM
jgi:hypothetical protein